MIISLLVIGMSLGAFSLDLVSSYVWKEERYGPSVVVDHRVPDLTDLWKSLAFRTFQLPVPQKNPFSAIRFVHVPTNPQCYPQSVRAPTNLQCCLTLHLIIITLNKVQPTHSATPDPCTLQPTCSFA